MTNKVLLFGVLADVVGQTSVEVMNAADTDGLIQQLKSTFPQLSQYPFALALNKKIVQGNFAIGADDELALLPPFAGG